MKNQAAPMTTENISKVIRLHLAIELSRKKWKLAFSDGRGGRARDPDGCSAGFTSGAGGDCASEAAFWLGADEVGDGQLL